MFIKNIFIVALLGGAAFLSQPSFARVAKCAIPTEVVESGLKDYDLSTKELITPDLQIIKALSFRKKSRPSQPLYVGTAGGPGSMKSTILETFMAEAAENGSNFVYTDPDICGLKFMVNTYL